MNNTDNNTFNQSISITTLLPYEISVISGGVMCGPGTTIIISGIAIFVSLATIISGAIGAFDNHGANNAGITYGSCGLAASLIYFFTSCIQANRYNGNADSW